MDISTPSAEHETHAEPRESRESASAIKLMYKQSNWILDNLDYLHPLYVDTVEYFEKQGYKFKASFTAFCNTIVQMIKL